MFSKIVSIKCRTSNAFVNLDQIEAKHNRAALHYLKNSSFSMLNQAEAESISHKVLSMTDCSDMWISPLDGEFKWATPIDENSKALPVVEAGLFKVEGKFETIWNNGIVPIMGGRVLKNDGSAMSDDELREAGFAPILDDDGNQLMMKSFASGGRVLSMPGPWIVPYIKTPNGVEVISTFERLSDLAGRAVNSGNIKETLITMAEKNQILLRLSSDMQFKGAGTPKFENKHTITKKFIKELDGQSVYFPALRVMLPMTKGGIGAADGGMRDTDVAEDAARARGAVFGSDFVSAAKLFDQDNFPGFEKKNIFHEAWIGLRMNYNTARADAITSHLSRSSLPSGQRAKVLQRVLPDLSTAQRDRIYIKLSLDNLAKSIRALYPDLRVRSNSSNLPDNYGLFMEMIDTELDTLKPVKDVSGFMGCWTTGMLSHVITLMETGKLTVQEKRDYIDSFLDSLLVGDVDKITALKNGIITLKEVALFYDISQRKALAKMEQYEKKGYVSKVGDSWRIENKVYSYHKPVTELNIKRARDVVALRYMRLPDNYFDLEASSSITRLIPWKMIFMHLSDIFGVDHDLAKASPIIDFYKGKPYLVSLYQND